MSENVTLSRNQKKALTALITEPSITRAAQRVGITPKTIYRYLELPDFRDELSEAQRSILSQAHHSLLAGITEALDTLRELHKSAESESVRRQAASDWISHALRLAEFVDIERRLQALESGV
jgi:hypothetical protein